MEDDEILFKHGNFCVKMEEKASSGVLDLVGGTIWGTPGKTQWKQMRTSFFLPRLIKPRWLTLYHRERPLMTLALLHRSLRQASGEVNSYFIRYLAAEGGRQRQGKSGKKKGKRGSRNSLTKSPIRQVLVDLFEAPQQLKPEKGQAEKAVFYAFVEMENMRSVEFCQSFEFEAIREFHTLSFSRIFPRKFKEMRKIAEEEKAVMLGRLMDQYKETNFFFTSHVFHIGDYYVFEKENEIVAGLQAISDHWVVQNLPGVSGKLIMALLPSMPLLSRLFNPRDFKLALFEGIFVKPGHEADLFRLMESVLADMGLHTAFIPADSESPLFEIVHQPHKLGLLNRLVSETPVQLIARFQGFSEAEVAAFREQPAYISAFDMA